MMHIIDRPAFQCTQSHGSILVRIHACHAEDPGSLPGRGVASVHRALGVFKCFRRATRFLSVRNTCLTGLVVEIGLALREQSRCLHTASKCNDQSQILVHCIIREAGLEPAVSSLGGWRLIRYATRATSAWHPSLYRRARQATPESAHTSASNIHCCFQGMSP